MQARKMNEQVGADTLGSGVGGGTALEHELRSGWAPFGRLGFASTTGTSIKQVEEVGLDQVKPFGKGIIYLTFLRINVARLAKFAHT